MGVRKAYYSSDELRERAGRRRQSFTAWAKAAQSQESLDLCSILRD